MEETEYRVPVKVLTNRDPIIANKLSIRELVQWGVFALITYMVVNHSPLPLQYSAGLAAIILMFAAVFIHAPVNGLAGLEWLYIKLRYRLERKLHQTEGVAPITAATRAAARPKFTSTSTSTSAMKYSYPPALLGVEPPNQEDIDKLKGGPAALQGYSQELVASIKEVFNKPRTMQAPIKALSSSPTTIINPEQIEDEAKED